jgi:hypothetical protein
VRAALILVAACSSPPATGPKPPVPTPVANTARTCASAAAGLEHASVGIREPDTEILGPARSLCARDVWPTAAIDCFATMTPDDLGRCAALLGDGPRNALFALLEGNELSPASIAVARAKLSVMHVGIAACDRFIAAVSTALTCEAMPLDTRVQLGNETADFWSLPTKGLPADAQAKMTATCDSQLQTLQQHVASVGCMP